MNAIVIGQSYIIFNHQKGSINTQSYNCSSSHTGETYYYPKNSSELIKVSFGDKWYLPRYKNDIIQIRNFLYWEHQPFTYKIEKYNYDVIGKMIDYNNLTNKVLMYDGRFGTLAENGDYRLFRCIGEINENHDLTGFFDVYNMKYM